MIDAAVNPGARRPAKATPLRIGLFGLFGSGNFGNDASLAAMIELVRRAHPDARLVCFCDAPERIRQRMAIEAVPIRPLNLARGGRLGRSLLALLGAIPHLFRAIFYTRKIDALIVPGTGILDDFGCGPNGMPLDIFIWSLAARLARTPFWLISIGAGPIVHPLSRQLMVWAAKLARHRSYRDAISKLFLAEAGVDTRNDLICPDLAFDLARPIAAKATTSERLTVGVGVMDYWGWGAPERGVANHGNYQNGLSHFCVWLLERGYHIRLLPGDDADQAAIQALGLLLKRRLSDPTLMRNVVAEPAHDLNDVMSQMAATDIVVATRFHNVVCALKMGKPTLSLSYAQKNAALLDDAGLGSYVHDVESFDVDAFKAQFQSLVHERKLLATRIAAFLALTRVRLGEQEQLLHARLAPSLRSPPSINGRQGIAAKPAATVLEHDPYRGSSGCVGESYLRTPQP